MTFKRSPSPLADAIPHNPVVRTHRCVAAGCPGSGTIFEHAGSGLGMCAYHYAANAQDWPRITQTLVEWKCVLDEIQACRKIHTDPATCTRNNGAEFDAAVARLEPLAGAWWDQLKPFGNSYRDWGRALEVFIGGQVQTATRTVHRRSA